MPVSALAYKHIEGSFHQQEGLALKVFLSYAKEDVAAAKELHDHLKALGLDPWMDRERLLPGQRWEREIDRALNEANVVILFMSPHSISKRSFVTREANTAVQNLRYKKADDIYIIPVLLAKCDVPQEISEIAQYIEYGEAEAKTKIVASIMRAAEQQKIAILNGVEYGPFRVFTRTLAEEVLGQPGYVVSLDYPEFASDELHGAASSLSAIFAGRAHQTLVDNRTKLWEVDREHYPEPSDESNLFHMNGRWDSFGIASANEKMLSVYYDCSWYGAGAAHPNHYNETFNFAIANSQPFSFQLQDLFSDVGKAAEIISRECRRAIEREYWNRTGEDIHADEYSKNAFLEATTPELKNFDVFTVAEGKLSFYFAPYQVAAYALGSWVVDVSLYDLRDILERAERSPLQI